MGDGDLIGLLMGEGERDGGFKLFNKFAKNSAATA
jgi:hypothetical protein